MGLLNYFRDKRDFQLSQSTTTSGVGKEVHLDWAAMTDEQGGYYSALTMSKNLRGIGLTFRSKCKDQQTIFTLSVSEKAEKLFFDIDRRYKLRIQFANSIVLYAYLHAYKQRHATIVDMPADFIHHIYDSQNLKIQYLNHNKKKVTIKFSLDGASRAIKSTIARSKEKKDDINPLLETTNN